MLDHLSRLVKHSAVYGLAETVSRGTGFVLMFMYVRMLSESVIGVRGLLYTASAFVALFYTLGLNQAFLRYFMDPSLKDRRHEIFTTSVAFSGCIGLVFLALAMRFGPWLSMIITGDDAYVYPVILLFVIMILDTVVQFPMLVLRAENRFGYFIAISLERFVLFIVMNLVFIGVLDRGLDGIFEANLVVVAVVAVSLLPVFWRNIRAQLSAVLLKRMLVFGIPTIFTLLAMRIIDLSDRRLIEVFLDVSAVGRYGAAYTLGMVGIMVFVNSFRTAWQPFFLSIQDRPEAKAVFSQVATYYSLFISYAFLGMVLFRDEIFFLYAPDFPQWLADIIPFVAFSYILYGFYIVLLPGAFIREKTLTLTVAATAGALVNIGLNSVLIPRYGIVGAAYATIAAYAVMVTLMFLMTRNIYHITYDGRRIAVIALVTAVPIVLSFLVMPSHPAAAVGVKTLLCLLPPVLYTVTGFWLPAERAAVRELIGRFRRR